MKIDWAIEYPLILASSVVYGVDPYFIAAVRVAENGGPGREFGVLSVPAPTYADQLRETCITVRNHKGMIQVALFWDRRCYSASLVLDFAMKWAPPHAENDPSGMNESWYKNAWSAYSRFCQFKKVE